MTELNPEKALKPIAEFAGREDFPECAVGEFVDIGGFSGVVTNIIHNSIQVKSPEGLTRRFNFHTLRKLYGPPPEELPPIPAEPSEQPPQTELREMRPRPDEAPPEEPQEVAEPNFDQETKLISQFAGRSDFPECALGQLVEIRGYEGVVVQIIDHSLIVRSREGTSRRYNADILRKLHGK